MAVRSPVPFRIPPCSRPFLRFGASRSHTLRFLEPSKQSLPSRLLIAARATVFPGGSSLDFNGDPPSSASPAAASSIIDFLTLCHRLKTTKRKGWIKHGIDHPESIADHMYRMALMSLVAGEIPGVDRERCIKIAIVHDIAEVFVVACYYIVICEFFYFRFDELPRYVAIVGDITPSDGIPKAEKSRREQEALDEMCRILGGGLMADEIQELWQEYENNSSTEASLVKDFDKVEMILQALEYETEHGKILDEFFISTAGKFQTDVGKSWAAEVVSRRTKRLHDLA
ncbi:hypothetical protein ZIOFF_071817 [Zingiber officinale]|uniref:5'-deoxynucleotidase n=1 Tax=Zingiber officinale TaxID=94328 RepID=A0A8J5C1U4_ZINOF|nr:hypothetical protein ZIOFF_071817 [Zingiber officinale]